MYLLPWIHRQVRYEARILGSLQAHFVFDFQLGTQKETPAIPLDRSDEERTKNHVLIILDRLSGIEMEVLRQLEHTWSFVK